MRSVDPFAYREDVYERKKKGDVNIHWFSILNSVIIIIFLFAIISIIIVKTIRRDINQVILFYGTTVHVRTLSHAVHPSAPNPSGGLKLVF